MLSLQLCALHNNSSSAEKEPTPQGTGISKYLPTLFQPHQFYLYQISLFPVKGNLYMRLHNCIIQGNQVELSGTISVVCMEEISPGNLG